MSDVLHKFHLRGAYCLPLRWEFSGTVDTCPRLPQGAAIAVKVYLIIHTAVSLSLSERQLRADVTTGHVFQISTLSEIESASSKSTPR